MPGGQKGGLGECRAVSFREGAAEARGIMDDKAEISGASATEVVRDHADDGRKRLR